MKKALITGGTKLLGSHLADLLVEQGYEVHVTGREGTVDSGGVRHGVTVHACDIRDRAQMEELATGATYIFHLAAKGNVIQDAIDNPVETESVNVGGTLSMLEVAKAVGVKKFIFVSSAAVYGKQERTPLQEDLVPNPTDPYGLFKYFGEQLSLLWSREYGVPTVSLRIFNIYGPRNPIGSDELVIGRFINLRKQGMPLTIVGDGSDTRDFIHVRDAARALVLSAESDTLTHGEVLNIGSGVETSLKTLAQHIGGPVTYVESLEHSHSGPNRRVADISKAKELLHWEPQISLTDGLEELKAEVGVG